MYLCYTRLGNKLTGLLAPSTKNRVLSHQYEKCVIGTTMLNVKATSGDEDGGGMSFVAWAANHNSPADWACWLSETGNLSLLRWVLVLALVVQRPWHWLEVGGSRNAGLSVPTDALARQKGEWKLAAFKVFW